MLTIGCVAYIGLNVFNGIITFFWSINEYMTLFPIFVMFAIQF